MFAHLSSYVCFKLHHQLIKRDVSLQNGKLWNGKQCLFKMVNGEVEATPPELFDEIKSSGFVSNSFIALSFLNTLLVFTTTLGNVLIVLALWKKSSIHLPSRLLLRSLAFTDLCVGLISQPLAALHAISILTQRLSIFRFTVVSSYITSAILSGVSLFILTVISVDRLLALSLGVRYRQTMTIARVRAYVIFSWVVNITNGLSRLLSNKLIFYSVCITGIFLCVVTSTFCYTKIYYILRLKQMKVQGTLSQGHHNGDFEIVNVKRYEKTVSSVLCFSCCHRYNVAQRINVQPGESRGQPNETNESSPLQIKKYKKTVTSVLWVHLALLTCYRPFSIVSGMRAIVGDTFPVAEEFTATLVFFNSSLNPVLYCWRIREVRQAVKETIREYCGFLWNEGDMTFITWKDPCSATLT